MIYFDNAATTYPKPQAVYEKMDMLTREISLNARTERYESVIKTANIINDTRMKLAEFMGAQAAEDVVFTSSATEAAAKILRGYALKENTTVYVSPYEHSAVIDTIETVREQKKFDIKILETDKKGYLDIKKIACQFMHDKPDLVCINMASNVTGYILPFDKVADMAKEYGAFVIADAAQAAGNIEINLKKTNIDILLFTGHKSLYGLFGVGGFIINSRIVERDKDILPVVCGEDFFDPGSSGNGKHIYEEGRPGIAAIGTLKTAVESVEKNVDKIRRHNREMLKYFVKRIEDFNEIKIFQKPETEEEFEKHIAIVSIAFEKYIPNDVGTILDGEYNIVVRTGYHFSPLVHDVIGSKKYGGTVRISMGRFTTKKDVDKLVLALDEMR